MNTKLIEWVLRIAVAGEFIGHGILAVGGSKLQVWGEYLAVAGIGPETATTLIPVIGAMDIVLGLLVLVRVVPIALLWMTVWGFATALVRPLAGEPIWDFVERFANWGAPLALLFLTKRGSWWHH